MHNFKDFNIKPKLNQFVGDKIKIKSLLNMQIIVLDFKIEPSRQKQGTDLLTIQIEKSGDKRVIFTGSKTLIDQIKQVPKDKFPFTTTIVDNNECYEFT